MDAGDGDDTIATYGDSRITAGEGNDWVHTSANSVVDAGAGNDTVIGNENMTVSAGAGNDEVRVIEGSKVDAGEGDDLVVTYGNSTLIGGAGNDVLVESEYSTDPATRYGNSVLDGGEGDDYLQASRNSTLTGGAGNDVLRLMNTGGTVIFNKGDGQDQVLAHEDLTVKIGGYSKDDVIVTEEGDLTVVSFKGSDDVIKFNIVGGWKIGGHVARLTFEDGSTLDVRGNAEWKGLNAMMTRPEWDPKDNTQFAMFSAGASTKLNANGTRYREF